MPTPKTKEQANSKYHSYTLFSVTREDRLSRSQRIRDFFKEQPALAYLMAAINLEWTIRRAIVVLSPCPTKVLWKYFESGHIAGWNVYQAAWKKCISRMAKLRVDQTAFANLPYGKILTLAEIVYVGMDRNFRIQKPLGGASVTAKNLETALNLRHTLVHGQKGSLPCDSAKTNFDFLLNASESIAQYVETVLPVVWPEKKNESGIFGRIVRTKCRCQNYEKGKKCPFQMAWDDLEKVKTERVVTFGDAIQYLCFNKNIGDGSNLVKTTITTVEKEKLRRLMKMSFSKSTLKTLLQSITIE